MGSGRFWLALRPSACGNRSGGGGKSKINYDFIISIVRAAVQINLWREIWTPPSRLDEPLGAPEAGQLESG